MHFVCSRRKSLESAWKHFCVMQHQESTFCLIMTLLRKVLCSCQGRQGLFRFRQNRANCRIVWLPWLQRFPITKRWLICGSWIKNPTRCWFVLIFISLRTRSVLLMKWFIKLFVRIKVGIFGANHKVKPGFFILAWFKDKIKHQFLVMS